MREFILLIGIVIFIGGLIDVLPIKNLMRIKILA